MTIDIKRQPNIEPYLFLTENIEIVDSNKAICRLNLSAELWYFKAHWPGNENMPAALQLESMTQLGGLMLLMEGSNGKYIYVRKIDKSIFYKMIRPEQELYSEVEIISRKRGVYQLKGMIKDINDSCYSKAIFTMINPKEIEQFEK